MYFLTQNPKEGTTIRTGGHLVGSVYLGLALYFGMGFVLLWTALRSTWKLYQDKCSGAKPESC
jgi:hypothetical protein